MKAELDVDVCWSPMFWVRYANAAITPSEAPPSRNVRNVSVVRSAGPCHARRRANGASTAAPTAKRIRLKPIGVVLSSASWTIEKVTPYRNDATAIAISGKYPRTPRADLMFALTAATPLAGPAVGD